MAVQIDRGNLERLSQHPSSNSNLKKKLRIINKLKQLGNENFDELAKAIKSENLKKFDQEIVNAIVVAAAVNTTPPSLWIVIEKLTRVIYFYSFDQIFMEKLKKSIRGCLRLEKDTQSKEIFIFGCLWLEIVFIERREDIESEVIELLRLYRKDHQYKNILGILVHAGTFKLSREFRENVKTILREFYSRNKITEDSRLSFLYNEAARIFEMSEVMEHINKNNRLIHIHPDEFAYYETFSDTSGVSVEIRDEIKKLLETRTSNCQIVEFIEKYRNETEVIEIFAEIKNFNVKHFITLCTNTVLTQVISRMIAKYFFLNESVDSQNIVSIILSNSSTVNLDLVCELCKYRVVMISQMKSLLNGYLKQGKYSQISRILMNTGRYLLQHQASADFIKGYIEVLERTELGKNDRTMIGNALSYVYKNEDFISNQEFAKYLIANYDGSDKCYSDAIDFLLLCPAYFASSHEAACLIIKHKKFYILEFYISNISQLKPSQNLYRFVEIICIVIREAEERLIDFDSLLEQFRDISVRIRLMIIYMEILCKEKKEYIEYIDRNLAAIDDKTTNSLYYTFSMNRNIGYCRNEPEDFDSFEYEMRLLEEY